MIPWKILFHRKDRLKQIIIILKILSADVMLLQEVMQAEYKSLFETFDREYYVIKGKNINWYDKKSSSGNVTFLRKSVFSLFANNKKGLIKDLPFGLSVKCYYLDQDQAHENVCENLCASNARTKKTFEIEVKGESQKLMPIAIVNVHLDDASYGKRIAEIKSLAEEIKGSKKVIVGGDFNQDYKANSNLYKLLYNMGLKIHIKDPTYLILKKMCIDHLMTKGFGKKACGCVVNNFGDNVLQQFKAYGSDHLPIIIQI